MIKAVIFDLGGVLFTNGTKKFATDLCSRHGLEMNFVKEVLDGELGSLYREAKISRNDFWKQVLIKLNIAEDIDLLEKEWIDDYELIDGTKIIISELAKKYRVLYLSDNIKERVEALDKMYGFVGWFSGGVFSHEAGVRKPNPKIYELALKEAGVEASEALFVDDKESCLETAREMGMETVLFETPEKLRESLLATGLLE
jgi:FMN phosphatase YigB (HAD superfamily)